MIITSENEDFLGMMEAKVFESEYILAKIKAYHLKTLYSDFFQEKIDGNDFANIAVYLVSY